MIRSETHFPGPASMLYHLKQLELSARPHMENVVQSHGISVRQYITLCVLHRHGPITTAAVARELSVTDQSAADMVHLLAARALVDRVPNPHDGRQRPVVLLDAGRRLLAACEAPIANVQARMTSELCAEDSARMQAALEGCLHSLRDAHVGKRTPG